MIDKVKLFLKDESGMETLEYALIAGLIAIVAVFVYTTDAGGWAGNLRTRLIDATTAAPAAP